MPKHLKITVEGKVYDVVVEDVTEDAGSTFYQSPSAGVVAPQPAAPVPSAPAAPARAPTVGGPDEKVAPLAGVIIEVSVSVGAQVKAGDKVAVIEAMKMKTVVSAHKDGKVTNVAVKVGDAVEAGQPIVTISS
jgi:biotin carboxyl carrier protein